MSKLFIVPTPVGNLEDITLRAIRVLKEADLILAEDTRQTSKLLKYYDISNQLSSYHKFNEHKVLHKFTEMMEGGQTLALVSDAGTPGISDPGFLLVRECIRMNIQVECLPGATAFVPALINSGFPCDRFVFEGFLPQKKGRKTRLSALVLEERTLVFYESPYRLVRALEEMSACFGHERMACVSRELSKIYEENRIGTLADLANHYKEKGVKGEIVIVVHGCKQESAANDMKEVDE